MSKKKAAAKKGGWITYKCDKGHTHRRLADLPPDAATTKGVKGGTIFRVNMDRDEPTIIKQSTMV